MSENNNHSSIPSVVGGVGLLFGTLVSGWIAYSRFGINHQAELPKAINADQRAFSSETTRFMLGYYANRNVEGRPLVLIHSINAGASAYEMRPIFEHYREQRPVYALDLPGFGMSERLDLVYSPELYTDAIIDFLQTDVGKAADVVALSLGSEFAARAALLRPDLFHSLALISPSGFTARERKRASQQANQSGSSDFFYKLFSFPLWGRAFYDLLATRTSIDFFLRQSFEGQVDAGLADYDYASTHQPGAHYAPLYFVSGKLFSRDIREEVYERLTLPVLVLYDKDAFVRFDSLPDLVTRHTNWHAVQIAPTRGLPHFEKMGETAQALDIFWGSLHRTTTPQNGKADG